MADVKISDLTSASDIADNDTAIILDVSDTTQAATGTTKQVAGSIFRGSKILTGSGVPSSGLGDNGDFYIDTDNDDYYTKASGSWTLQGNLAGGGLTDVVNDTSPQLGGNLDVNGNDIVSVSNGDINITPDGTGEIVLDGLQWPQADGTNGQKLTTDGAGQLSFTNDQDSGAFAPSTLLELYDDFVTGNEDSDELGTYGWRKTSTGTGNVGTRVDAESGHPGIYRMSGGTAGAARSLIYLGESGANTMILGGGEIIFECVARYTGTIGNFERMNAGIADPVTTNGPLLDGVFFEIQVGDTNWHLVSANGGTETRIDTGIAATSAQWYRLKFTVNSGATSIQANIDGSDVGSALTTNIPTAVISPIFKTDALSAGGGTATPFDIDYMFIRQTFSTAR